MHFEKSGSGKPVILIHGLGASSFSWRGTVAALSTKYTTYNVDLLGFGNSLAPTGFAYTAQAQADAVADFMAAQKRSDPLFDSPSIIGHSMGGGVCLDLADRAARGVIPRLGQMVLVSSVAFGAPSSMGQALGALAALMSGRELAEQVLKRACVSPPSKPQIDGYAKGMSLPSQIHAFVEHSKTLSQISFSPATLGGITTETLVIWGRQDPFLGFDQGEKLVKSLGNAKPIVEMGSCGHIPQEEKVKETNEAIKKFLK
jgi:pimeloyl-ACP methyl ester carboxylesterase